MELKDRKKLDLNLLLVLLALTIISLLNLYSATHSPEADTLSRTFVSQLVWFFGGWVLFFIVTYTNLDFIKRGVWIFYSLNLILLLSVKFFGKSFYGAKRWLDFGFFRYQPSETMKVTLVLALSLILYRHLSQSKLKLKDLLLPFFICLLPFLFTVTQPDLGTSLVMFIIGGTMVLFIGVDKKILISVALIGSLSLPIVWNYGLKSYQKQRVLTFLNPGSDIRGGGYNSHQSKIAVGSGLLLGRGYLKGTQSQLQFLPERHTDFIFSVLSEEHGFIGSFLVLFLFLLLFLNIINTATISPDSFGTLVCIGTGAIVFWHMFINIAMITGMMPVVGVPLPLFSYGGSSILTTMASLGLVSNVSKRRYLFLKSSDFYRLNVSVNFGFNLFFWKVSH